MADHVADMSQTGVCEMCLTGSSCGGVRAFSRAKELTNSVDRHQLIQLWTNKHVDKKRGAYLELDFASPRLSTPAFDVTHFAPS